MTPTTEVRFRIEGDLHFLLHSRHRAAAAAGELHCPYDGTATLEHLVESLGIPRTEVGALRADGRPVPPAHRPHPGALVDVAPVPRPQPLPEDAPAPPRFLLDVHLGALARRLRLVGVDTAYGTEPDAALVARADDERRILLTRDRALLHRRALWLGAHVRGSRPDDQLTDVLGRFPVPLAPWTRCPACNGLLEPVPKAEIAHRLPPGTRRTYDTFTRCTTCTHLYWPGAHHPHLTTTIASAHQTLTHQALTHRANSP